MRNEIKNKMVKSRRQFPYKKIVMASISVLSVFLFVLTFGVIGIYASQTQTIMSNITIAYNSTMVDGNMRLRAYYKGVNEASASWHTLTRSVVNGTAVDYVKFYARSSSNNAGSANLGTVAISGNNNYIVFECAFKNTGSAMVKMAFAETGTTMVNMTKTQLISKSAIDSNFDVIDDSPSAYSALAVTGDEDVDNYIDGYVYYYIKVRSNDLAHSAQYAATQSWAFTGDETVESIIVNNNGGNGGLSSVSGIRGACPPILKTSNLPTKSPYSFYGYYSSATNDEQYYRASGEPTRALPLGTDPLSLYAQYSIEAYVDPTTHEASWPSGLSKSTQTRMIIPNSVISIGNYAFSGCTGLTSIVISDSVTSVGNGAFRDCTGLTGVTIGNRVESIGGYAFEGCSGLTSVIIPDSVTSIGDGVFYVCTGLTSITIPDGVTRIEAYAFFDCTGLTSITIPDGVTSIGDNAFAVCTGLTSITIPNSVTSITYSAFHYCTGLTSLSVESGNTVYHSAGNCIIETNTKKLVVGCNTSVIPTDGSVTSVGRSAFSSRTGLTSITIPDGVTRIEAYAFDDCTGLTSITLPDSVTSIGGYAFDDCTGLTSITLPSSVTSIGSGAFYGCTGLTQVTINRGSISSSLTSSTSCGRLISNARTIYILDGLSVGSYVTSNFTCSEEPVDGYWIYTKNS